MHHHRPSGPIGICLLAIALVATLGLGGCKPEKGTETVTRLAEEIPVIVQPVTRIETQGVIEVSGALKADKTAPLAFLVPGKVDRVQVDEGDRVERGQLLATVESHDYRNNLEIAEASLFRAKDAYDRFEPLYREGAFAEKNFIELKAGLAQAEAARNIARKALADTRLCAPIAGIVGGKGIEVGQMVSAQVHAFTIVKTDLIYARLAVPESEIGQLAPGQKADVTITALDGRIVRGKVTMIGAVADDRTRTYPVEIELANPDAVLRPGMLAQATILTEKPVEKLTVPGRAIVRDADNLTYVFVVAPSKSLAQRRRVTPGAVLGNGIEIRNGLAPEDLVIVAGQHKLGDGAPIIITAGDV